MKRFIVLLLALYLSPAIAQSQTARYQIVLSSLNRMDRFMIDTQTGKIWQAKCMTDDKVGQCFEAWFPVHVAGITISEKELYKKLQPLPEAEKKPWETEPPAP